MQPSKSSQNSGWAAGFTLPAILVVVGALLILAVGLLLVVGIERSTARSYVDRQRAELVAGAAIENVRGVLELEAANDDFLVLPSALAAPAPITAGRDLAPKLFIARGKASSSGVSYRYVPLFSNNFTAVPETALLEPPVVEPLLGTVPQNAIEFQALPHQDKVRAAWLPVQDDKDRLIGRYAFWVEDLQSKVDPAVAGNANGPGGSHLRSAWPFPAPGLSSEPFKVGDAPLDQIGLHSIDPAATDDQPGGLGTSLLNNRKVLISPDSLLAAAGFAPPIARDLSTGHLSDPKARAVEENLATGLRPYDEQPVVPYAVGIDSSVAGLPKLNLNQLLSQSGDSAVGEMAAFIKKALPRFDAERKGGFLEEDYLKTLAANAIDYADSNNEATVSMGSYRGLDGYPLVSEFLLKVRWENIRTAGRRKFVDLSVTTYVELWNMTNVVVEGSAAVSYETKYGFQLPPNPNLFSLGDLSNATNLASTLTQSGGYYWFAPFPVKLQPNEYRVFKCGTVNYSINAASSSEFVTSPMTLSGETLGVSGAGYRMRWNDRLVDQSRGAIHRNDASIHYPLDAKGTSRQRFRTSIPSHSHNAGGFVNNMGDPRMSAYNTSAQDANVYPQNFSPNRRNIRLGSIYNGSNVNTIYGRVLPSEWPDGGHDSPFGVDAIHSLVGLSLGDFQDEHRVEPDDARFYTSLPSLALGAQEAPTRLSNSGRFFSATELGRIYDPIMWQVRTATETTGAAGRPWGDVLSSSVASSRHGGGNTLRIGRPEHPLLDAPGTRASHLLDLFHAGRSRSDSASEREGKLVEIKGHVNINTASKGALRAMLAGRILQDPEIRKFTGNSHTGGISKIPVTSKLNPLPDVTLVADRIADAIIRSRPFASTAQLADTREADGTRVFGNSTLFPGFGNSGYPIMQWTDAAAEETFARTYEASTVRSRNFRIWVIGQALSPTTLTNAAPEVLAELRRAYTVFADPGERKSDGTIDPTKFRIRTLHEKDF
jgi:type II secretory pathway pseudopilin PulG